MRAGLGFALPTLIVLAGLDRLDALVSMPAEFDALAAQVPRIAATELGPAILVGVPIGLALTWLRIRLARRRGKPVPKSIVAPTPLAARDRAGLGPASAVAVVAGITEELAFRLALPLLLARLTGDALVGFGLAAVPFLALHRYQRWPGRIGVACGAAALTFLYLSTGALWFAMLVHALVDVMALAVRPWLAGFGASSSVASPSGKSR